MISLQAMRTENRVVITGASSGLGAQCAVAFAKHGAVVVAVARRRSRLAEVERAIRKRGGSALAIKADVTKPADIELVRTIVNAELGGADILINNAGFYSQGAFLVETNLGDWTKMIDTNLRAPYLLCRAFVPGMLAQGYGRVVNITSATNTLAGVGLFRVSKIGLEAMTAVLAAELESTGVTATAFNPGWMKTDTSGDGRSPKGAASALVNLVERSSVFLNGNFVDLTWIGRRYQLRRRVPGRGQFGF